MNQINFGSLRELVSYVNGVYAVTDVDTVAEQVVVNGDITDRLSSGDTFDITGSTGNNGTYTINTIIFSARKTTITVTGDITDATVDGDVEAGTIVAAKIEKIWSFGGRWWLVWWD